MNFSYLKKMLLSITSIIQKDGTTYSSPPPQYDEFITAPDKWYEVDALAENTEYLLKTQLKPSDDPGIKVGRYIETENRFISEYTPEGYCKSPIRKCVQ